MQQSAEKQEVQNEREWDASDARKQQEHNDYQRAYIEQCLREMVLWQRRIEANSY